MKGCLVHVESECRSFNRGTFGHVKRNELAIRVETTYPTASQILQSRGISHCIGPAKYV